VRHAAEYALWDCSPQPADASRLAFQTTLWPKGVSFLSAHAAVSPDDRAVVWAGADGQLRTAALPGGGSGLFLVDAASVQRVGYRTFDGQRGADILFDAAPAQPLGEGGDAGAAITATVLRFQSALCAEAVGAMDESLRLTTDYLKTRKQFGVPLKSFQTLTQRAADMYVSLELARSMSYYLAVSLADGSVDPTIGARAKLQSGRSGQHIAQESIQLHGGIGVTAEYPIAHYAARLTAIDQTFGSAGDQLRHLVSQVGSYGTVML
jgi:alkylation response protein AidB-like acyl-CoA dehydrogenase